jgi:four helix bundle protein
MKSYRELEVWKRGIDMVVAVYATSKKFPADEKYGLQSQLRRAAVSVPANIAEGYGRKHRKEYLNHLSIAQGSLTEMETHLIIALRLDYVTRSDLQPVWALAQEVGKMLNKLRVVLSSANPTMTIPTLNPIP